jgi:hypothetical protein
MCAHRLAFLLNLAQGTTSTVAGSILFQQNGVSFYQPAIGLKHRLHRGLRRNLVMSSTFDDIITHDASDECLACRAQDIVNASLVPAVAAWEDAYQMPRNSLAVHGAASLMAFMIQSGVARKEIESAVAKIVDDYELQIAEEGLLGGPHQGTA